MPGSTICRGPVLRDPAPAGSATPRFSPTLRLDLADHSPTDFEWGYEGSGPAQLALALLADALGDENRALALYPAFKEEVVAALPASAWRLSAFAIRETAHRLEDESTGVPLGSIGSPAENA